MTHKQTVRSRAAHEEFVDPAYPVLRQMRRELVMNLRRAIHERGWNETEAAAALHVGRPRIAAINEERWQTFTLELLLTLAIRVGLAPRLTYAHDRNVVALRQGAQAPVNGPKVAHS